MVGATRAGTTSLWIYLQQHPDIFMPQKSMTKKEPSFFCDLTPSWATEYRDYSAYLSLFADAKQHHAVGEASTLYLVSPESPGRIRETYPDAKIVIVLRNPADRAYSLYRYLCLVGVEHMTSFEKALEKENQRFENERFRHNNPFAYYTYLYFRSGLYAAQVERYLKTFPREQVHVTLSDDLLHDPIEATRRVYRFLGVDAAFAPEAKMYNRSQFPLSVLFQYSLGCRWHRHPYREPLSNKRIDRIRRRAFELNATLGRLYPRPFDATTRHELLGRYRDDIKETASLIGRNLDSWLDGHGR